MGNVFSGKKIIVGVSGSIAAFKVAGWVSALVKEEACVSTILTGAATKFVTPLTFSALTGDKTYTDMFFDDERVMSHIYLGQDADLLLLAPATAQTIARLAYGMADDLLSTTVLAAHCPIIICPAMNSQMYNHPATTKNLEILKSYGYIIVDPESGRMACKDEGKGRLVDWEKVQEVLLTLFTPQDMAGEVVLVTAGPTREPLDPARFISNRSSGKMGYALATTAKRRGAKVVLVSGPTSLDCPDNVERVMVNTALEMQKEVVRYSKKSTIIVKAAAVSDFRPKITHDQKVKKEVAELSVPLEQNPDILYQLGQEVGSETFLVGFAAESTNILQEGQKKLQKKNLDMIAVNDISGNNTGFEADTNQITLLEKQGKKVLPLVSKEETANLMWEHIMRGVSQKRQSQHLS